MLVAGNRRATIKKVVSVFIQGFRYIPPKIKNELLTNTVNRKNRMDDTPIITIATADRPRDNTKIMRMIGNGYRKRSENVPSARRLAIKNCRGVMGDVKTKLCSYSNAVTPL